MTLWSSADAESATMGKASARFAVGGLSIDTRTLQPGEHNVRDVRQDVNGPDPYGWPKFGRMVR